MNKYLRKIRQSLSITQAELAAHVGLCAAEISHYETGRRRPSIKTLKRLIKFYNKHKIDVKLEQFLDEF